jgi:hypothetical protein
MRYTTNALAIFLTILLVPICGRAAAGGLEEFAPHFSPNTKIIWKAPSHSLPAKMWVYKKQVTFFPQAVISNAIILGSLQGKGALPSSIDETCWDLDKNCPCGHPCTLSISPTNGSLCYSLPGYRNASSNNLPTAETVVKRAWQCAQQLGLDRSQLAQKDLGTNYSEYDEKGRSATNNACSVGLSFARIIDGWECYKDNGGFSIEFGSGGQIRSFSVEWPKLIPYQNNKALAPAQIISSIRTLRTVLLPHGGEDYHPKLKALSKATKITITKATPRYSEGEFGVIPTANNPAVLFSPFVELEMVAGLDGTNLNFQLACPILESQLKLSK